ncbi:MAG TPA: hypothetical protein VGW77_34170 [Candidatus Binatia bacterium]|nr:hypothetical protein [Candidatus Binatia bacterium]
MKFSLGLSITEVFLHVGARSCGMLVFAILSCSVPVIATAASPEATATEFVKHIQRGAIDKAKGLLENSGYRYRQQGGDDIYFRYDSGYDPNFAFLVGRQFGIVVASARQQRSDWYLLDGTIYADVALTLRFEKDRPWLLPAPIAFGRAMDFITFMNFVAEPGANPERLSLRIRPSIDPGLIKPPTPQLGVPAPPVPFGARVAAPQVPQTGMYGSIFGSSPVDPAPVVLPSGEPLTTEQLGRFLPRLSGITLNLSLIRWGRFSSWSIVRWSFVNAVLATEKGEVRMGVGPSIPAGQQ